MQQLLIRLNGQILDSNFEQFRIELLKQIHLVNRELNSDEDYIRASSDIRLFKAAETALKQAKKSALDQTMDIGRLFDAIDAVALETRGARLALERQVKARKAAIRQQYIDGGIESVKQYILQQPPDFQLISHAGFIDRGQFDEAIKRKTTARTAMAAIDRECRNIRKTIDRKSHDLLVNADMLSQLRDDHKPLFQDRTFLLDLSPGQLGDIITQRINAVLPATSPVPVQRISKDDSQRIGICGFQIILDIDATRSAAQMLRDAVAGQWMSDSSVRSVRLVGEARYHLENIPEDFC